MKFFVIEPIGRKSYLLFDTMEGYFNSQGHQFVTSAEESDICFYDEWCGFGEYNQGDINTVLRKRVPVFSFNFHDYNDTITWPGFNNWEHLQHEEWAVNLRKFIDAGLVKGYFMRKMNKYLPYPEWVRPIECIQYPDHDFPLTTLQDFVWRPNDVCFIGAWSKERESVINGLVKSGFIVDYQFTEERIPHDEWIDRHRKARFFLSADGGGYGDERVFQLSNIACILRQINNHRQLHPLVGGIDCIKIHENPTEREVNEIADLKRRNENIYEMYKRGAEHVRLYYSADYRAKYILYIIQKHI